jgi:hypothetical protein
MKINLKIQLVPLKICSSKSVSFIFLILTTLILGCASEAPKKISVGEGVGSGSVHIYQWEAKAFIKDKKRNISNTVAFDMVAQDKKALRIEASTLLGINVASLLLKQEKISYAIQPWKRFYSGESSKQSLYPVLKIKMDPQLFYNFLYDETVKNKPWICETDENNLVKKCNEPDEKIEITWSDRDGYKKRVSVEAPTFMMQIVFKNHQTLVEPPKGIFNLDPPEDFKKINLL